MVNATRRRSYLGTQEFIPGCLARHDDELPATELREAAAALRAHRIVDRPRHKNEITATRHACTARSTRPAGQYESEEGCGTAGKLASTGSAVTQKLVSRFQFDVGLDL